MEIKVVAFYLADFFSKLLYRIHDAVGEQDGYRQGYRKGGRKHHDIQERSSFSLLACLFLRFCSYAVQPFLQLRDRGFHLFLGQHDEDGPADGLHRRIRDVARNAVNAYLLDAALSAQRFYRKAYQGRVRIKADVFIVLFHGQHAALEGGEQNTPQLVDYADVAFVPKINALYKAVEGVQIHARACDTHQLIFVIHGNSAHYAKTRCVGVLCDGRYERVTLCRSALIPGTALCVQRHKIAVFIEFAGGYIVGLDHGALFGREIDGGNVVVLKIDGIEGLLQVAQKLDFAGNFRVGGIDARGIQHLQRQLSVLCRVRKRNVSLRVGIPVGVELFRGCGDDAHCLLEFVKGPVRDRGFVGSKLLQTRAGKLVHGFRRHGSGRLRHLLVGFDERGGDAARVDYEHSAHADQRGHDDGYYSQGYLFAEWTKLLFAHYTVLSAIPAAFIRNGSGCIIIYNFTILSATVHLPGIREEFVFCCKLIFFLRTICYYIIKKHLPSYNGGPDCSE